MHLGHLSIVSVFLTQWRCAFQLLSPGHCVGVLHRGWGRYRIEAGNEHSAPNPNPHLKP